MVCHVIIYVIISLHMQVCIICSVLKTWHEYTSEYLSVESWREWWSEMLEIVRTSRQSDVREVDNDESPAVEVLNYRSPAGYFASTLERLLYLARMIPLSCT